MKQTLMDPNPDDDEGMGSIDSLGREAWQHTPATDLQALMETPPHVDPERSLESGSLALRDIIADAIDALPEKERFVFERIHIERCTFAEVAAMLSVGTSTVDRICKKARAKLQERLSFLMEDDT